MSSNPLKVLAALSASAGVSVSGSSGLVVKQGGLNVELGGATITGNVSGSGTLQVGSTSTLAGDVTFGSNILKASDGATALTLSAASGDVAVAGDLKVSGNDIKASDGVTALTLAASTGDVTVAGDLKVSGNDIKASDNTVALTLSSADVAVAGDLTVTGGDIKSSGGTTALTLDGANVTVAGNLTVRGTTTSIDSTTVNVGDLNLNLGTGSNTLAGLNGGGLDLGQSANVQMRYDFANSSWTSNVGINVSGALPLYRLNGKAALTRVGTNNTLVSTNALGTVTYAGVSAGENGWATLSGSDTAYVTAPTASIYGSVSASINAASVIGIGNSATPVAYINAVAATVSGSSIAALAGPSVTIQAGSEVNVTGGLKAHNGLSSLANSTFTSVTASSNAKVQGELSGAAGYFSSLYIDGVPVGTGTATKAAVITAYNELRYVVSGTLNGSGQAIVNLTTAAASGSIYFAGADLHKISVDVMTDADGTGWTNDLIAVKLYNDAGSLKVQIDAPAAPSAGYRLVAINESDFTLA